VISPTQVVVRLPTDAVVRVTFSDALTPGQRATAARLASSVAPGMVEMELWEYDLGTLAFAGRNLKMPEERGAARAPYAKRQRVDRQE